MSPENFEQDQFDEFDKYDLYAMEFEPVIQNRQARRKRKPKQQHIAKVSEEEMFAAMAERVAGIEGEFTTTYKFGRYEEEWLLNALRKFYEEELIVDILASIKGGKEASVYRCQGHETLGKDLVAAKVYRPRRFRNLSNDAMYRQGRRTLDADGKPPQRKDHRISRAIDKKTDFGVQVQHTSWLQYEFTTMKRLYEAGGSVPEPISAGSNAILMDYIGDEYEAAKTLNHIRLDEDEAQALFKEVQRNIELMLDHGLIHGDLSAYNILYWEGEITLIDFPQIVQLRTNSDAEFILKRDLNRICQYFIKQGVDCDPDDMMADIWYRYMESDYNWQADEIQRVMSAEMVNLVDDDDDE
ncbi:MAG: RIO1 family regulatory kinase/ATPase [Chloroflexota bacterium]